MKISVVIPNYNGRKLLEKNLPKVLEVVGDAQVIVIDDASNDESAEYLKSKKVILIENEKNLGFSSTVNKGIDRATGELIVLLNTDITPKKGFLEHALPYFRDKNVFAVGCMQKCPEDSKVILRGRGVGKFKKGFLIHSRGEVNRNDTLWVSAGAGIFRKRIWENLGGLCEAYNPFYWEDIDISYRAQKAGYKIYFEPKSVVKHDQGATIKNKFSREKINTTAYRNQFFFVWLNVSDPVYLFMHLLYLPIHMTRAIISGDASFLKGFFQALFKLSRVLKVRQTNSILWEKKDRRII